MPESMSDMLKSANAQRRGGSGNASDYKMDQKAFIRKTAAPADLSSPAVPAVSQEGISRIEKPRSGTTLKIDHPVYSALDSVDGVCPACNGMKHVFVQGKGWVRCSCLSGKKFQDLIDGSEWHLPYGLVLTKPESFTMRTSGQKKLGEWIKKAHEDPGLFTGTTCGTALLLDSAASMRDITGSLLARLYMYENINSIKTYAYARLNDAVASCYAPAQESGGDCLPSYRLLVAADFLVLSFGDEATNNGHRSVLYELLYNRSISGRKTLVLASCGLAEIGARYGRQAQDLIKNTYDMHVF